MDKRTSEMNEMSPELKRALESIAVLQSRTFEDVCAKIRLRGKKEVVIDWTPESGRYLPARMEITSLSWMIYYTREYYRYLYRLEAEQVEWELDNELLYGIHWGIKHPELDFFNHRTL